MSKAKNTQISFTRARESIDRILEDIAGKGKEEVVPDPDLEALEKAYRMAFDLHTQSIFSDGEQTVQEMINEAKQHSTLVIGVSDHINLGPEDKEYEDRFARILAEEFDENHENFPEKGFKTDLESIERREASIEDVIKDDEGCQWYQNSDIEMLLEDISSVFDEDSENPSDLHPYPIVMTGVEVDFNPFIEEAETDGEKIQRYTDRIEKFIRDLEKEDVNLNYVNLAVHDVLVDGELKYVKKDELFEDLSDKEKLEVFNDYRDKIMYTIDTSELDGEVDTVPERMQELDVYTIGVHPALIERNDELMRPLRKEKAEEDIQEFIYNHHEIDGRISDVENFDEVEAKDFMDTDPSTGEDLQIDELYPEDYLREFWEPVAEEAYGKSNHVFEVNGKHFRDQYHNSVLWQMLEEYTFGSDQHRAGEHEDRIEEFGGYDLPGEFISVLELEKR